MKQALVTGGAGFIGQNLCRKLLSQNIKVIAIDNFITSGKGGISDLKKDKKFKFVTHDITKALPRKIQKEKIDTIYHLACPTGVDNLEKLGDQMLLTCSTGTKNVLELARKQGSKFVFTSSSEIYGKAQVFPQKETYGGNVNPTGYRSTYEEGKRFSESLVAFYVRKFGLDARIVRVFNTYGPGMSKSDSRVIPRFMNLSLKNEKLTVEGKGTQTRTFCYVDDLVLGLILIAKKGKAGEVYNLGSNKEIKIIDLTKKILIATGNKKGIKFINRPEHDHNRRLPDISKIKKLGWTPKVDLTKGLRRTIKWYGF